MDKLTKEQIEADKRDWEELLAETDHPESIAYFQRRIALCNMALASLDGVRVPEEPTKEMIRAGLHYWIENYQTGKVNALDVYSGIYRAMLAARPKP